MLFAKSPKGDKVKGLAEHCREVMDAFEALFGSKNEPSTLVQQWLRFFNLNQDNYLKFHSNGLAACGLHDIGKANDGFQNALNNRGEQLIRHEHLSGLILAHPKFHQWLESNSLLDVDLVISAVIGHHLKASWQAEYHYPAFAEALPIAGKSLLLLSDTTDFKILVEQIAERLGMVLFKSDLPSIWSLSISRIKALFAKVHGY